MYQKLPSLIYDSWDTEWDRHNFLSFWAISCPFSLLTTWKIKILKLTKTTGDIIILHIGTINDNYIMHGSWDMERDRQFFVILDHFLHFYPLWTQKILKNEKNTWRYYHFTNMRHIWQSYDVWILEYGVQQTQFLSFSTVFCPFTPLTTCKIKILKQWKNHLETSSFYTGVP